MEDIEKSMEREYMKWTTEMNPLAPEWGMNPLAPEWAPTHVHKVRRRRGARWRSSTNEELSK